MRSSRKKDQEGEKENINTEKKRREERACSRKKKE